MALENFAVWSYIVIDSCANNLVLKCQSHYWSIYLSKVGKVLKESLMQEYRQENFGLTTMAKTQSLYPKNSNPGESFGPIR